MARDVIRFVDPYRSNGSTTGVYLIYRRRKITFGVCLSWFLRLCWFMVYRTRNITVGVSLSWFLRLCWFMVYRTTNITFGVCLSWFLRLCWFMVYRTKNITVGVRLSCRADRTDRMNRIALCPDVIMRCTLRMCSAYGP